MKRTSTVVAVVSGKGGTGKSMLAVNLAETLHRQGTSVALLDVDLGQSDAAILLNEAPRCSAFDLATGQASLAEVLHPVGDGFTLVQAVQEAGQADGQETRLYAALDDLLARLRRTHTCILIDAPAGVEGAVRWALDRADLGLLVLVGEPTAITDAYRLARYVWHRDATFPFAALVNMADSEDDAAEVAARFNQITRHFVGKETMYLGGVPFSAEVRRSVAEQTPVVRGSAPLSSCFQQIARTLLEGRKRQPPSLANYD
jgi:flagellar biosynthesis protein FlhG